MGRYIDMLRGDKNTLYYIGNGFDLFHDNVKSKFIHFYSWLNLKDKDHEQFASMMERIYPDSGIHGNLLWTDFEESLGNFNIDKVHQIFAGKEEDGFFDEGYQKRAANIVHDTFSNISIYLKEWAKQIDIEKVKPLLTLGREIRYLTFNYTLLLEKVYKISPDYILHIHNSIEDDEPLIVGHDKPFPQYFDDTENTNIQKSQENLAKEITMIKKPVDQVIKRHRDFFNSLGNITKIIVFGHSLSSIDMPYFKEVLYHVHDNAEWYFTVYNDEAKEKYKSIVDHFISYFNNPKVCGVSQYKNKIKFENCKYIVISEIYRE